MAASVRGAVDDAERLIDALLTLAKADQDTGSREPVDLDICVEDALDAAEPRITARSLHVTTALQPAIVHGEPVLLARMIANLIDNAIRYNDDGGSIDITTASEDSHATLRITNTGAVVPQARVGEIFEPFQRLNGRTGIDGAGLGLSIVHAVALAHNGSVDTEASPDGGLMITVHIPAPSDAEPGS